jgi:hypothetical protein
MSRSLPRHDGARRSPGLLLAGLGLGVSFAVRERDMLALLGLLLAGI